MLRRLLFARRAFENPDPGRSGGQRKHPLKMKRGATETAAPRIFSTRSERAISRSIRADRPAPARAPVAARSDEAIAVAPATTPAATAATSPPAATTTAATNTPSTTATATATTTGFRRGRRRGRDNERRANEADRIDQHQRCRRQGTFEEVRTCLDLSHKKNLHFRKRRGALPRIQLASLRPVQARSENR